MNKRKRKAPDDELEIKKMEDIVRLTDKQLETLRNKKWDDKSMQKEAAKSVAYVVRHHSFINRNVIERVFEVALPILDLAAMVAGYLPVLDEDKLEESIYLMSQYLWLYGNEKLHRCFRIKLLHQTPQAVRLYLENCLLNDPSYFLMVQNGCNRSRCFVPQHCTCNKPLRRIPVVVLAEQHYREIATQKRKTRKRYL